MRKLAAIVLFAAGLCVPVRAETPTHILALTERVADWQLARLQIDYHPTAPDDQMSPTGWVYGALFSGITALADISPEPRFAQSVRDLGEHQSWDLERRPFHADDYVIGQSWVWAYRRFGEPKMIAALRQRFDAIVAASPQVSLEYGSNPPPHMESACQLRWCWADSLFMGPPAFAALSVATGDGKYLGYADREFWATADFLYDRKEHLFARDSRFFTRRGEQGKKIFWSRGNGWVYAGLVHMLQLLPADHPSRSRYETLFRQMSARLITLQKPDGTWPVSLLAPPADTPPETSGTGFYVFGLAYGVRTGLLSEAAYRQSAARGWQALEKAVDKDGMLGWVQGIGVGPDAVKASDTHLFGVGAFLLAGVEIYRLALADAVAAATTQSAVTQSGYGVGNINAVSMARNTLFSAGTHQFAVFYGAAKKGRVPVLIARRSAKHPAARWHLAATPFLVEDVYSNTGARDDHNLIAAGIDAKGFLHLSFGMHNVPLNYAVTKTPVLGSRFAAKLAFTRPAMIGRDENEVTYPEFFHAPDGTLMFAFRNGGAGGGSGNGNEYLNRYDEKTRHWVRVADPMVDGMSTSMNAYLNSFAYDAKGRLFASWTIRETPGWTNHDIYLVRSDDGGKTWSAFDGIPLGKTIDRASADAKAKIVSLPIGANLINQTAMTLDAKGRPEIATWWSSGREQGIATRQVMLVWHDGKSWQTSQVSQRDATEDNDPVAAKVREMGRPLVLTDRFGRTLVVARFSAAGKPVTDSSNRLILFWSDDRRHWLSVDLSAVNPGLMEPVYDARLWQRENKLALFFQPSGLGEAATPVSILTIDVPDFFRRFRSPPG